MYSTVVGQVPQAALPELEKMSNNPEPPPFVRQTLDWALARPVAKSN
jgi:hypothetical protein